MKKTLPKIIWLTAILVIFVLQSAAYCESAERIISYDSDIVINKDSSLTVTESIKVFCNQEQIKRGIYRDFPTKYTDKMGNHISVGFNVLEVLKNGEQEPYKITNMQNGKRIYVGSEDVFLDPGEYTYTIKYQTVRQLGFFDNYDELYWNVTGNGWIFPIETASARVTLPEKISSGTSKVGGYTGILGSSESSLVCNIDEQGRAVYQTTRELYPNEGLTIFADFPKNIVQEPSLLQNIMYWIGDNVGTIILILGMFAVLFYYLIMWSKYGKDPNKGTIIPLYEPPLGLGPQALRFIRRMGYDNKAFTAAIINLAVKKQIKIKEKKGLLGRVYTIEKEKVDEEILSDEENTIISDMPQSIELKQENYVEIHNMMEDLKSRLSSKYERKDFLTNLSKTIGAVALSILFISIVIVFFGNSMSPVILFLSILIFIIINAVFSYLMKAPTIEGRKLMDDIEGFRMFLSVTEKERLNLLNPPDKTPELFEKYLPYAIALDVENKWSEQFADVFERLARAGQDYSPSWYIGNSWTSMGVATFASSFSSSFNGAISSSSTAPGSSSGGIGGFSGGGGGGGGGGGW